MPTYQAWIPITVMVKATVETDEPIKRMKKAKLLQLFREEGETEAILCDDCKKQFLWEEGSLDCETEAEIEVEEIEDDY